MGQGPVHKKMIKSFVALLLPYVLYAIGAAAIIGGVYFAWQHYVAAPYRAEGRLEMVPALVSATNQLERDIVAFKEVDAAFAVIKKDGERVKKQIAIAQAANANRRTIETTRIADFDRIVPTGNSECERTSDAIKKVLR